MKASITNISINSNTAVVKFTLSREDALKIPHGSVIITIDEIQGKLL